MVEQLVSVETQQKITEMKLLFVSPSSKKRKYLLI